MQIRLYVEVPLDSVKTVQLGKKQHHYLIDVMRRRRNDEILLFNGHDGEWRATIDEIADKHLLVTPVLQISPQTRLADIELLFAPLRKGRTEYVVEKATELGARSLRPVITKRTQAHPRNMDRLRARAIEAAEQCGLLTIPEIAAPKKLAEIIDDWDSRRILLFCDESGSAPAMANTLAKIESNAPSAIIVGPEGGFAPEEAKLLRRQSWVREVSLGPRILRADTASIAALSLFQAICGDWSK